MDLRRIIHNGASAASKLQENEPVKAESDVSANGPDSPNRPNGPNGHQAGSKPRRRFKEPPRYARVWKPEQNKINDDSLDASHPDFANLSISSRSRSQGETDKSSSDVKGEGQVPDSPGANKVGPCGAESLTGLSPSISGKLPIGEVSHFLANWVFQTISSLESQKDLAYLEIEFKLGTILDPTSSDRLNLPVVTEAVINPDQRRKNGYTFKSEINHATFKRIEDYLDSLEPANEEDSISKDHVLHRDDFYKIPNQSDNVRVTSSDKGQLIEAISKKRIGDIFIHSPEFPADLRVTISIERPMDAKETVNTGQKVLARNKNRLSWITKGARVDLTSVHTETTGAVAKEAEIEVNSKLLVEYYKDYLTKAAGDANSVTSMDKFLEVLQYSINTCRALRKITT